MYALTRFNGSNDPFAELARDFFRAHRTPTERPLTPSFDVFRSESGYAVRADLPGVAEENLEITVHEGILSVTGKRSEEFSAETDEFLLRERRFGDFSRRLRLPKDANPDDISASLKAGVLTIEIGKRADLVVLSQNPLTVETQELLDIDVIATYARGKEVFRL